LAVNNIIEGTVREDFDRLRITVRVLGADGFQVSSHRFETIADAESLIRVQEQIATAFISRARPEQSRIRQRKAMPGGLMIGVYPLVLHAESLLDEGTTTDLPAALRPSWPLRDLSANHYLDQRLTLLIDCHSTRQDPAQPRSWP
jgi:hypothetical protein